MGSFSLFHWIIVLVVVLLLFGPRRLPDLARGVGDAIREFKKAVNDPSQSNVNHQLTQGQVQQQSPTAVTPPTTTQPSNQV